MEIEKISVKFEKIKAKLAGIKKAGKQAKSWAGIGEQYAVDVLNHIGICSKNLPTCVTQSNLSAFV